MSRLDEMKSRRQTPKWPPNPARYLTDWLLEIGPSAPGGMVDTALGWDDMLAWSRLTGVELTPWEAKTLRRLSRAFVNQRSDAREPSCPEPRVQTDEATSRSRVDEQFAAMAASLQAGAGQD